MRINQDLLDEVTRIKVNIMQRRDKHLKSIMIAGTNRGEGTSTVAANLALSIALGDKTRVLLVDANVRKPTMHIWFGREQENGFIDLLTCKIGLDQAVKETAFANIKLVTAGFFPPGENKLDVLSTIPQGIKESLERDFDWVIYDSPPVSGYPDTLMLSPLADGIILVIMAERTRRAAVQKVKENFESINANILGGVLNGRRYVVPKFIYKRL